MGMILFEVYKEYYKQSNLLGKVIPLKELIAPIPLKEYIRPHLVNFFKFKRINEGFFVITIEHERKTFIVDCELKDEMITKMEIHF